MIHASGLKPRVKSRPLGTRTLSEQVRDHLQQAILNGEFESGERLDLDNLITEFGTSRMPLREALRWLEADGLVVSRPHRGVFVATLTATDIRNLYEVRVLLEVEVVRRATSRMPPTRLASLEQAMFVAATNPPDPHTDQDLLLHRELLEYVENDLLVSLVTSLKARLSLSRVASRSRRPEKWYKAPADEHLEIVRAMRSGDAESAARLMAAHLRASAQRVAAAMPDIDADRSRAQSHAHIGTD